MGCASAYLPLGHLYELGLKVAESSDKAKKCYTLALENVDEQEHLGLLSASRNNESKSQEKGDQFSNISFEYLQFAFLYYKGPKRMLQCELRIITKMVGG